MNVADSQRLASELERLGYWHTDDADEADVIVLNTCVVRQQAEDKIYGRLGSLRPLKERDPDKILALMGCLVGVRDPAPLRRRFPWVDVFMPPSDPGPLLVHLADRELIDPAYALEASELARRYRLQEGGWLLPAEEREQLVAAYVPIVLGCSHACAYCIIPHRRGAERSRSVGEIVAEARGLVSQGVKEITLLGQIVDRYGRDIPDGPSLSDLLRLLNQLEGLERIRFLTSHPNWMSDELLEAVAELPKVCEHIEVPVQAGDDEILAAMRRGYTADDYRRLVERIRARIPGVGLATDIIVGFPGETAAQFQRSYDLVADIEPDKAHIAKYSPRPGTLSARTMPDDVPPEEKERRRKALDALQTEIATAINARLLGQTLEVLVEGQRKGKWYGRTRSNKLIFFEGGDQDWRGRLVQLEVTWTGPWSMQGQVEL